MKHPISWIEFATGNTQATHEFFNKVFNWDIQPSPGMPEYYIFNPGAGPMGAIHPYGQPLPRTTVYLYAPDIDAKLAEIEAAGGKVITPKMFMGDAVGNIAHFADPNGNTFGLWDRERVGL